MKKTCLRSIIPVLIAIFLISSCERNNNDTPQDCQTTILGNWKITGLSYSPAFDYDNNGVLVTDAFPLLPACEKDDITTFNQGGTYISDKGSIKCNPSEPQTLTGTWSITDNCQTLTDNGNRFKLISLDQATFRVVDTFTESSVFYSATLTFTKQ